MSQTKGTSSGQRGSMRSGASEPSGDEVRTSGGKTTDKTMGLENKEIEKGKVSSTRKKAGESNTLC